jgi:hypothetical protein
MVASSSTDKTKEADALRDAVAAANKEKTVLGEASLQKQLADGKDAERRSRQGCRRRRKRSVG